jgi:hypothetical protein
MGGFFCASPDDDGGLDPSSSVETKGPPDCNLHISEPEQDDVCSRAEFVEFCFNIVLGVRSMPDPKDRQSILDRGYRFYKKRKELRINGTKFG